MLFQRSSFAAANGGSIRKFANKEWRTACADHTAFESEHTTGESFYGQSCTAYDVRILPPAAAWATASEGNIKPESGAIRPAVS